MPLVHFLLVYDRAQQKLVFQQAFSDAHEGVREYERLEAAHRGDQNVEIVLVGADSIETVKLTHGNYFEGVASASPYLAGV